MDTKTMSVIELNELTKSFGTFTAVDNLCFSVEKGCIFGFLGPNGSGKSTCIRMLCGLLKPTRGSATVLGYDIVRQAEDIKQSIGYMSQGFSLYKDLSVHENLEFFGGVYGQKGNRLKERMSAVVDQTGLAPYLDRRAGQLSGGWKQRLALAAALIHEPSLVFLDEPTAGIDPVARRDLWDLLFELAAAGTTLFVTTHYMDEAERCSDIGYIYLSKLMVKGPPAQLKSIPAVSPKGTRRLSIALADPARGLMVAKRLNFVLDATLVEAEIHLVIPNELSDTDLRREFAAQNVTVSSVRPIDPSLEDVFVSLTRNYGSK